MGCAMSEPSSVSELSEKQKQHIRYVWTIVKDENLKQDIGNNIYKSLLHSERQLRYLFPKIVMEDGGEKFTVDESVLERHASLVMDGIGFAVTCLDDLPKLNKFLVMLGNHHNEYGVPFEVLEKLWAALDGSFSKNLPPGTYVREVRKAWTTFFSHMICVMKTAMNSSA